MLSVATYLLALTAVATPIKGTHRSSDSPAHINADAECTSGDSLECAREPVASDMQAPALASSPCPNGALSDCTPAASPLQNGASLGSGEGLCDSDDSAECLMPVARADRAAPPVILSCESSYLEAMIGSCDLPDEEPSLGRPVHLPTLRSGAATRVAFFSTAHGRHAIVISSLRSTDGALIGSAPLRLASNPPASALFVPVRLPAPAPTPPRLDRPPRV